MEPVRLVIWDLDGVFWNGTLSEGGMDYRRDHHDIVISLAKRGILSSICSKNDIATVQPLLEDKDIWRYFVFPSINWEAKGKRIAALVQAVQLRPESILFIDDNPMNLAEAAHYVPGLQTAGHEFIPALLDDPRFSGKDDADLSRLEQYRQLEQRHKAAKTAGQDNFEFLRQSDIRLTIDYDIEANIDRAIELINRTNQLNFTKKRLPEDAESARRELRCLFGGYENFSGLIRLTDRYGDHGYIGFFCIGGSARKNWLHHFCFSCRVLNMGVERWVYRWLDRPSLKVIGDVACNIWGGQEEIDWITLDSGQDRPTQAPTARILDRLVLRGGCDMRPLSHYFSHVTDELYVEASYMREKRMMRIDHSAFLDLIADGVSAPQKEALVSLGYTPEDWTSGMSIPAKGGEKIAWVISLWMEAAAYLYEHKQLGFKVPFCAEKNEAKNLLELSAEGEREALTRDENIRAFAALKDGYIAAGYTPEAALQNTLAKFVTDENRNVAIVFLLGPETVLQSGGGEYVSKEQIRVNQWIRASVSGQPNIHIVESGDFLDPACEREFINHFDQLAYYRIAQHIIGILSDQAQA